MSTVTPTLNNFKFELPGLVSRGYHSYAVATAFVHSGRFNIRGREYHSYGFCSMVLQDLVADLAPTALVIPQFELDAFTVTHGRSISITDSIASLTQPKTRGPIPDFVIVIVRTVSQAPSSPVDASIRPHPVNWKQIKIGTLRVGMLVEVKRRPTRSAKTAQAFRTALGGKLHAASVDAREQAAAAFIAHEETNRIILVAFSGEWFSWRLAVRKDFGIKASPRRKIIKEADEVEFGDELGADPQPVPIQEDTQGLNPGRPAVTREREQPARDSKLKATTVEGFYTDPGAIPNTSDSKVPYTPNLNPKPKAEKSKEQSKHEENTTTPQRAKKSQFIRYEPASLTDVMPLLTPEEYDNPWSKPILMDTPESEQNWFLIHRFLKRINTRLNEPSGPGDSDDEDDHKDEGEDGDGGENVSKEGASHVEDDEDDDYLTESSEGGSEYKPDSGSESELD